MRTSQYSTVAPAVGTSGTELSGGGFEPTDDGTTLVFWKGDTNNNLYTGVWFGGDISSAASDYPDTTTATPAIDGCDTSYLGTNTNIYYDSEPFFGTC